MAKASVAITVNNQMKSGLESAKKDLTNFEQVASKVGDTLKSAFTVTAVIAGINQLAQSAKQCVTEFSAVDQANRQLEAIWKNVGDATGYTSQQLLDYADSIEKVTYFEAESVQSAAQLLASTQKLTKEGFQRALDASVDLAAALGTDVSNAAQTLSMALQDPEAGLTRLRRVGITFTDSEKEMIKALADAGEEFKAQEIILDKVESKYKGIAEAVANTPTNTLTQISNTLGTIKEGLGEGIVYALEPAFDFILSSLRKIENWVNKYNTKAANDRDVYDISEGADLSKYTTAELAQIKRGINLSEIPYYSFETDASTIAYREIEQELRKRATEDTKWYSTAGDTISEAVENAVTTTGIVDAVTFGNKDDEKPDTSVLDEFLSKYYKETQLEGKALLQSIFDKAKSLSSNVETGAAGLSGAARETALSKLKQIMDEFEQKVADFYDTGLENFLNANKDEKTARIEEYQAVIDSATAFVNELTSNPDALEKYKINLEQANDIQIRLGEIISDNQAKIAEFNKVAPDTSGVTQMLKAFDTSILDITDSFDLSEAHQINELYSSIIAKLKEAGLELGGYTSEEEWMWDNLDKEQKDALDTSIQAIHKRTQEEKEAYIRSRNFLYKYTDKLRDYFKLKFNIQGVTDTESKNFSNSVVSSFTSSMGEAGEVVNKLATNMQNMGPILGAIATALEYVFEGLNEIIGTELDKIVEYGLEPLREIGRVLGEVILPLLENISPLLEIVQDVSKMLFNAIGSVFKPIFELIGKLISKLQPLFEVLVPIMELIAEVLQAIGVILESILKPAFDAIGDVLQSVLIPVIKIIGNVLETLSPVLKIFATIFVTVTGTLEWIGNVIRYVAVSIWNWAAELPVLRLFMDPIEGVEYPGRYSDFMASKYAELDEAFSGASSLTESDTSSSTSTSVSSAGYMGATQVTINIYQQAPVVGDAGMREFARMIKSEFDELSYYGVTT